MDTSPRDEQSHLPTDPTHTAEAEGRTVPESLLAHGAANAEEHEPAEQPPSAERMPGIPHANQPGPHDLPRA
ncbi:hypothetical protein [Salana multivorans]